ncbi:hypothetical protein [Rhodococcus pyridinivorans]|uniref:hypothetical protein n=1 Tax=Rhodococcus pyridinivorans TaxID=103816 RepID=UPI003AABD34C
MELIVGVDLDDEADGGVEEVELQQVSSQLPLPLGDGLEEDSVEPDEVGDRRGP